MAHSYGIEMLVSDIFLLGSDVTIAATPFHVVKVFKQRHLRLKNCFISSWKLIDRQA